MFEWHFVLVFEWLLDLTWFDINPFRWYFLLQFLQSFFFDHHCTIICIYSKLNWFWNIFCNLLLLCVGVNKLIVVVLSWCFFLFIQCVQLPLDFFLSMIKRKEKLVGILTTPENLDFFRNATISHFVLSAILNFWFHMEASTLQLLKHQQNKELFQWFEFK